MPRPLPRLLAALLLSFAVASCGVDRESEAEPVGTSQQEIIGGTLDSGDLAVVALAAYTQSGFGTFCTGTLVAPQTILTAAHCVYAYGTTGVSYYAHFGPDAYAPMFTKQIVSQTRHPNYTQQGTYDIAVLKLVSPISTSTVTPVPINTTALNTTTDLGRDIRHAGFGVSSFVNGQGQSDGKKRQVTTPLRQIQQLLIESGASNPTRQTCSGDSGGPGFMTFPGVTGERVVGVVAFGDQYCQQDGYDTRVDAYASWVQSIYNQWEQPQCTEDGRCASGCAQPDIDCVCAADQQCTAACPQPQKDPDCPPDCSGGNVCSLAACPIPDPDCVNDGATCSAATQCKGRRCVGDPQHVDNYCSRDCVNATECPSGMTCDSGACRWIQKPVRLPFAACTVGTDYCYGGTLCTAQTTSEQTSCQYPCTSTGGCNAAGQTCVNGINGGKFCKDPNAPAVQSNVKYLQRAKLEGAPAASTGPLSCSSTSSGAMIFLLLALMPLMRRRVV